MSSRLSWLLMGGLVLSAMAGCNDDAADVNPDADAGADAGTSADAGNPDGGGYVAPSVILPWQKVEPSGAICGNGSQYKFFVQRSLNGTNSNNLLIYLEPGGACWDYESCIAHTARGAANPDGIPDDHMATYGIGIPLLRPNAADNPLWDWTKVFVSYCTGDVHTGSKTTTYTSPDGMDSVEWHHVGHDNVLSVIDYLKGEFPHVPKMLVTGCSAGGAGALASYYYFRKGLPGVDHGYMLDDSGPIFPAPDPTDWSYPLHQEIKSVWGVDDLLATDFPGYDFSDFGNINDLLSEEFPDDRLAITFFQLDYNYSLYSYERFQFNTAPYDTYPVGSDEYRAHIYEMWRDDTLALMDRLDGLDNYAYFLPFYRYLNSSHCATPFVWTGTEIQEDDIDLRDYINQLLDDDQPLNSYYEESCEDPLVNVQADDDGYPALTPKCSMPDGGI